MPVRENVLGESNETLGHLPTLRNAKREKGLETWRDDIVDLKQYSENARTNTSHRPARRNGMGSYLYTNPIDARNSPPIRTTFNSRTFSSGAPFVRRKGPPMYRYGFQ